MNEITFILALLYEKGIISKEEAVSLRKVAVEKSISNNLDEMRSKIRVALADKPSGIEVESVKAKELLK